ncbi:MAG: hypothetical protein Q8O26_08310 [Phreatobacter sp.]|nr:hypothetical protein [Phreatobacter sp.]MDP2801870.1 hypothetical protein [Phreatobacter sp.]
MPPLDITQALVTEPPLMALVVFAGLAMGAGLAVFAVDFLRLTITGKDRA